MFGLNSEDFEILSNILKKHIGDYKVYVFGSRATEKYKKYSDIDLFVDGDMDTLELRMDLEESLLPIKVDVLTRGDTSERFFNIIKDDFVEFGVDR